MSNVGTGVLIGIGTVLGVLATVWALDRFLGVKVPGV